MELHLCTATGNRKPRKCALQKESTCNNQIYPARIKSQDNWSHDSWFVPAHPTAMPNYSRLQIISLNFCAFYWRTLRVPAIQLRNTKISFNVNNTTRLENLSDTVREEAESIWQALVRGVWNCASLRLWRNRVSYVINTYLNRDSKFFRMAWYVFTAWRLRFSNLWSKFCLNFLNYWY